MTIFFWAGTNGHELGKSAQTTDERARHTELTVLVWSIRLVW